MPTISNSAGHGAFMDAAETVVADKVLAIDASTEIVAGTATPNATTGAYSITLSQGTYHLLAIKSGYQPIAIFPQDVVNTSIGDISSLIRWYDASQISGLSDGDPVSSWPDTASSGDPAVQSTSAARPVYKTSIINGNPVVRFDGSDNYLSLAELFNSSTATAHMFAVARLTGTGPGVLLSNRPASGSYGWGWQIQSATSQRYYHTGYSPNVDQTITDAWHVLEIQRDGLSITDGVDGSLTSPASISSYGGASSLGYLGIGGGPAGNYLAGDIAEIVICNDLLSSSDRSLALNELGTKYGITIS